MNQIAIWVYSGVTMDKARLIYDSNLSDNKFILILMKMLIQNFITAIKNTRSLGTETSTKVMVKLFFENLICIGDN